MKCMSSNIRAQRKILRQQYVCCVVQLKNSNKRGETMIKELMYIECKSGYNDDGPAWIGYVKTSRTYRTIYFNDHAFRRVTGYGGNYEDIETGELYWISGVKKRESNRHWAGHGKIMVDVRAVDEVRTLIGEKELPRQVFELVTIEDRFPISRIEALLNEKKRPTAQKS